MDYDSIGPYGALALGAQREAPTPTPTPSAGVAKQDAGARERMDELATRLLREIREQERVRDGFVAGAVVGVALLLLAAIGLS